jgi:hypothetical protein
MRSREASYSLTGTFKSVPRRRIATVPSATRFAQGHLVCVVRELSTAEIGRISSVVPFVRVDGEWVALLDSGDCSNLTGWISYYISPDLALTTRSVPCHRRGPRTVRGNG